MCRGGSGSGSITRCRQPTGPAIPAFFGILSHIKSETAALVLTAIGWSTWIGLLVQKSTQVFFEIEGYAVRLWGTSMLTRTTLLVFASVCLLLAWPAWAQDESTLERRGLTILTQNCSRCHAVGRTGASPHREAPLFRDWASNIPSKRLRKRWRRAFIRGTQTCPNSSSKFEMCAPYLPICDQSKKARSSPAPDAPNEEKRRRRFGCLHQRSLELLTRKSRAHFSGRHFSLLPVLR